MPVVSVTFRGSREELRQAISQIPGLLSGRLPDSTGQVRWLQLRLGITALGLISEAFLVKARGGVDESGMRWEPLKPETIARRRLGPTDRKRVTLRAQLAGLSPAARRAVQRDIRNRRGELLARGVSPQRAESLARAAAFGTARRAGGKIESRRDILSGRQVEVLRDQGILFASLSPGAAGNVLYGGQGVSVSVGSNLKKATWHHGGTRMIPARRLWPDAQRWPQRWIAELVRQLTQGVGRLIELRGGRP